MTGTYVLQSVRAKFNQYCVDPTCLLCRENPDDHEHFLLRCRSLTENRDPFIETIKSVLSQYLGDEVQQCICRDSELLVALILDCTAVQLNLREPQREDFLSKFESVARGLCYALHCKRTRRLSIKNITGPDPAKFTESTVGSGPGLRNLSENGDL